MFSLKTCVDLLISEICTEKKVGPRLLLRRLYQSVNAILNLLSISQITLNYFTLVKLELFTVKNISKMDSVYV